jgi:hypothetical protein
MPDVAAALVSSSSPRGVARRSLQSTLGRGTQVIRLRTGRAIPSALSVIGAGCSDSRTGSPVC